MRRAILATLCCLGTLVAAAAGAQALPVPPVAVPPVPPVPIPSLNLPPAATYTGRTVYRRLAGTGVGYNNNYAGIALDESDPAHPEYVGTLGGIVSMRDG